MPDGKITARGLNRATLGRQLLLQREPLPVADAVRRVVALQAQEPASPYVALWNRISTFDPAELDAAFAAGEVVKATLMRVTLHAVGIDDYRSLREAMEPTLRGARLHDRRFAASGLTLDDADEVIPELVDYLGEPRTVTECEAWLEQRAGASAVKGAWWAFRQYAPLLHVPGGGPWSFGTRRSFVAPRSRPAVPDADAAEASMETMAVRYLEGFGPASALDIAQFGMVNRPRVRKALQALAGDLERVEGPNGEELFDVPGALRPDEDTPAPPRLMAMWDSTLLAYADRSRMIPPHLRKLVIRMNGDALPTLLVDGHVAGVWRTVEGGIEATAFHPLADVAWEGLSAEAGALMALLAHRGPDVYRRYHHWWAKLPAGEVRRLA